MKKFLFLIYLITNFAFAISYNEVKWTHTSEIEKLNNIAKFGDIIIFAPKSPNPTHPFGHSLFVIDDNKFSDFPNHALAYREFPFWALKHEDRGFVLLRYKYMNNEIANKMRKLIEEDFYYRYYYLFSIPSNLANATYCSHFIWLLYRNTVGDILDFNYNIIRPFSFLESKYLEVVEI